MGAIIWVVSESPELVNRMKELTVERNRVVWISGQQIRGLPFPGLIIVGCDYRCDFGRCSGRFRLTLQFPETPICLARPALSSTANGGSRVYLGSWLNKPSNGARETWHDFKASLTSPLDLNPSPDHFWWTMLLLQQHIVHEKGRIARLSDLKNATLRSPSWLSKYFRQVTGVAPKSFIN